MTNTLGSTMKNALSPSMPALINLYSSKGEGPHKGPTKMKILAYEYADKMLNHEPPLAE